MRGVLACCLLGAVVRVLRSRALGTGTPARGLSELVQRFRAELPGAYVALHLRAAQLIHEREFLLAIGSPLEPCDCETWQQHAAHVDQQLSLRCASLFGVCETDSSAWQCTSDMLMHGARLASSAQDDVQMQQSKVQNTACQSLIAQNNR